MQRNDAGPDDQSHTRRFGYLYDNHGRKFSANLDLKTGQPVGEGPRPVGWKAPWLPSQEWARYDSNDPTRFRWDYEGLLAQRMEAHELYESEYRQYAVSHGWDPSDEAKRPIIESVVGKKKGIQPIELVVAAMQGNKYVLGLTDKVDQRIVPFLRKREDKKQRVLSSMNFADVEEDAEFEERMDIQEAFDPQDTPRGRVPVKTKRAKTAGEAA